MLTDDHWNLICTALSVSTGQAWLSGNVPLLKRFGELANLTGRYMEHVKQFGVAPVKGKGSKRDE